MQAVRELRILLAEMFHACWLVDMLVRPASVGPLAHNLAAGRSRHPLVPTTANVNDLGLPSCLRYLWVSTHRLKQIQAVHQSRIFSCRALLVRKSRALIWGVEMPTSTSKASPG
jgi:hypothetical protein